MPEELTNVPSRGFRWNRWGRKTAIAKCNRVEIEKLAGFAARGDPFGGWRPREGKGIGGRSKP